MGYAQAFRLLAAGYKKIKGKMPEGLDLLKIKQEARKKAIDAQKVIKVNFDKANNWMKAKPQSTKPEGIIPVTVKGKTTKMTPEGIMKMLTGKGKGKVAETEAQMLARMKKQNKESVARLKEKKEKTLGEKLKDYKGDPDAMKDGGKVKKKRKHNDNIDDEDIGEGESKERFLRVMPEVDGIPRSDGIMELATGGMTNISDTYDNNPTLQSQYPNKQDYLDLFAQQTTTTTPQTNTATQSTTSTIAPINPIKPIIKIPQDGGDGGGGITSIDKGEITADQYAGVGPYSNPDGSLFNDLKTQDEIDELNPGGVKGLMQGLGNFYKTVSPFLKTKKALAKGKDFALDIIQKVKEKALQRKINESIARESGSNSYQSRAAAHESKVGRSSGERMGRV